MTIKLKIFNVKYNSKGTYIDSWYYRGDIAKAKKIATKTFKSWTDMADWLDKHKKYKNHVMYARSSNQTMSSRVVFDGVQTYVEDRGNI